MQEKGEIIDFRFDPVREGPLTRRLDSNVLVKIVRYGDDFKEENMSLFSGMEKKALLNLYEHTLKYPEDIEPRISLEDLAKEINIRARSL